MPSRAAKILAGLGVIAVLSGASYWAGYHMGANDAVVTGKPVGASDKTITIAGGVKTGPTGSLSDFMTGKQHPDSELLDRWAKSLSLQECLDEVKQLQDMPAGLPRDDILKALVSAWIKKDPKGVLAGADGIVAPKLREKSVESALAHLAATNPKDALDWINQNAGNASNADMARRLSEAIGGMATMDPAGALSAALALGDASPADRQRKTKAVEGFAYSMADQGRFADALNLLGQMPAGKLQNDGLAALVDNWAAAAPQSAANYIATVQDASLVSDLGQSLVDVWSTTDPAAAAKWAVQMDLQAAAVGGGNGGNNGNDPLLSNVIDSWAKYDLTAAGQFLNQLPPSPTKDAAIVSFISRAAQDNPADTMKWVATVTDKNLQASAFMQTAKQWVKQDPASFNQFMNTTTALTDQQKQAVADALNKSAAGAKPQN